MGHQYLQALNTLAGGRVAFGSVGAGYSTLLTVTDKAIILLVSNTLNQDVVLSLDGGTTNWHTLPAGISFVLDFGTNGASFNGTIQVKHNGVAPTAGAISAMIS